jgi:hypothetical protein
MRKIESDVLAAIQAKKDFVKDNTSVYFISAQESGNPYGSRSEVYLHGNHIANYWHGDIAQGIDLQGAGPVEVNIRTLKSWPTNTTKSRLRALGVNLTQKKGVLYIDGVQI